MPRDYQIPEKYLCTMTAKIMFEPVTAADGLTYEREAIEEWLKTHDSSPKTNAKFEHKELIDDHDKQSDILAFLESHPELYNEDGVYLPKTPFHSVATRNDTTLLVRLLKTKAASSVDAEDANGDTALHLAARGEHENVIYLLLEAGAYHKLKNKQGQTPVELAIAQQKRQVANFIVKTAKSLKQSKLKKQSEKIAQLEAVLVQESKQTLELKSTLESQEKIFKTQLLSIEQILNEERIKTKNLIVDTLQSMGEQIRQLRFMASEQTKPSSNSGFSNIKSETSAIDAKDVRELLRLVVEGEQEKAEAMLKNNSALALVPEDVTDLSKRTFTGITAFQYAVWALDWHMWTMIKKYLPDSETKQQAERFETGSWVRQHGVNAQHLLEKLVNALQMTVDLYNAKKYTECNTAWVQKVGGAQLLLPVHVINEYCHPTRPFYPLPNFKDTLILPRIRKIDGGEWFTTFGGQLGTTFAVGQGNGSAGSGGRTVCFACDLIYFFWCSKDLAGLSVHVDTTAESVRALAGIRIAQREELITELRSKLVQRKSA